jgi:hypothetical protein
MTSLYNRAANEFPAMREAARRRRRRIAEEEQGIYSLFGETLDDLRAPVAAGEHLYEYVSPWVPYGSAAL